MENFIEGLRIMLPFFDDPSDFMSPEHGDIVFFAYLDNLTEASDEGVKLTALGFLPDYDLECWSWRS